MKYYGITDKGLVRKNNQDSMSLRQMKQMTFLRLLQMESVVILEAILLLE